ncbi:cytochrome b5 reductase 4-like isoform X6 [Gopherus evgoodei]|uniref:cytochrome b5 reductase 4-like isoform X6 n=1 Tax=Gopherus evgoodei TaxID=1825980 RepID=UPI0011D02A81|nr:cytochrome b5 reductase 4-like isoform X6 [Gopherus evgoodei]
MQVHRWVNYESMLKECLVGRMALKPLAATTETCCALPEEKKLLNGMLPKNKVLDTSSKDLTPSYDWFQTDYLVTVVIYTKQKGMNSEMVIVDYQDGRLRIDSILRDYSYLLHIELSYAVQEDIAVHVAEKVGKVEIVLKKKDNIAWSKLGQPLSSHNSFIKCTERGLYYRKCKLISKTEVTHDTKLFCLMLPQSTHLQVPVGHHIYLKQIIAGTEIVKPYTPVSFSLKSDFKEPSHHDRTHLILMIKIYPNGLFTPELDHLQIGDYISVSNSEGSFKKLQVQTLEDLFLLAAGTGFTPMVKLLNYVLTNVCSLRTVKLMFFNKTEDDILWRNQLEQLALKDKRFEVQFILSEPKKEGTGKQGKISSSLLSEFVKRSKKDSKVLICVCGPAPFTEQGIQLAMSAHRLISNRTSQQALSNSDYTWEYEYYEYGPVSFEGLKAHKYSIVIGFWVGLAVFVIFMFFVLTLLTKTGAPHPDNTEPSEKRFHVSSFVADFGRPLESNKVFLRPVAEESRSLFHFYINEVEHLDKAKQSHKAPGLDSNIHFHEVARSSGRLEEELNCLTKFNIPNFVNTDQNSSLSEDDLLISEPPIILESKPVIQASRQILD